MPYDLQVDTSDSALLITEPYFNLPNIQEQYAQLVFEEYEFKEYYRCTREFIQNPSILPENAKIK